MIEDGKETHIQMSCQFFPSLLKRITSTNTLCRSVQFFLAQNYIDQKDFFSVNEKFRKQSNYTTCKMRDSKTFCTNQVPVALCWLFPASFLFLSF